MMTSSLPYMEQEISEASIPNIGLDMIQDLASMLAWP